MSTGMVVDSMEAVGAMLNEGVNHAQSSSNV